MTEPTRYSTPPIDLPDRTGVLEPTPVPDCKGCAELAKVRDWARAGGDMTTVTDCNVRIARHPEGH
ncbi:hypothetical protein AB0I22_25210 [Streptomyces sp. NPDC050610]|uniref:hypothetical protein n=1 Tax=Streptomyces sp. NPDC050610 TaxID=3157097 RepID=UPI003447D690